jgi:hypothetical protein
MCHVLLPDVRCSVLLLTLQLPLREIAILVPARPFINWGGSSFWFMFLIVTSYDYCQLHITSEHDAYGILVVKLASGGGSSRWSLLATELT